MPRPLTRRTFLSGAALIAGAGLAHSGSSWAADPPAPSIGDGFPRVDLATIESFVGLAHRDVEAVRRMVERQPSLARASWDWGFGDWETGLGAAAHTGGREIARILLDHGAHPTLFSAAMLGQVDVVRAMIAASPGAQRTLGPHGLTLLDHAKAGGKESEPVVAFLESLGGADQRPAVAILAPADRDALVGRYRFGPGERGCFDVDVRNELPGIARNGGTRRVLFHAGDLAFFPSGVPSVRIAFAREAGRVTRLTVADPETLVSALREA